MADTKTVVAELQNKLGTRVCGKPGSRVTVTLRDVTATGTIAKFYEDSAVVVKLDGTGQEITVPITVLDYA